MDLEEIKKVIEILEKSSLQKFHLKEGDFELDLEKESFPAETCLAPRVPVRSVVSENVSKTPAPEEKKEGKYVKSPMVGTFYSSPAPDQPPFVKKGDVVHENTVVCIIEAMKVMNEIKAGVKGIVAEVLCTTAHPVEFGTKLFRIE